MTNRLMQAVVAGIVATAVMTVVGVMAPFMGLPRMNPAEMLSGMMGIPIALGWIMHFMIGIIFASAYVYWFNPTVKINSKFWKGIVFSLAVFVFAQIMMLVMGIIFPMPMMGDKMLMMLGSLTGHIVYGLIVAWIVPLQLSPKSRENPFAHTSHAS